MAAKQPPFFKYLPGRWDSCKFGGLALSLFILQLRRDVSAVWSNNHPFVGVTVVLRETYKFHLSNPYTDTYNVRPPEY